MKNKSNIQAIIAAAGAGAAMQAVLAPLAVKNDFVGENFLNIKAAAGVALGSGLVYMMKDERAKAAGYGLIGVGGSALASVVTRMIDTPSNNENEPLQGAKRRRMMSKLSRKPRESRAMRKMIQQNAPTQMVLQPGGAIATPGRGMRTITPQISSRSKMGMPTQTVDMFSRLAYGGCDF
jgi:hypothetical protein